MPANKSRVLTKVCPKVISEIPTREALSIADKSKLEEAMNKLPL